MFVDDISKKKLCWYLLENLMSVKNMYATFLKNKNIDGIFLQN